MSIVFSFLVLMIGAFGSIVWLGDRAGPIITVLIFLLFSILAMLASYIFLQGLGGTAIELETQGFEVPGIELGVKKGTVKTYGPPATFVLFFVISLIGWKVVVGPGSEIVHVYLRTEDSHQIDKFKIIYELADSIGQHEIDGANNHALLPNIPLGAKSLKVESVKCQDYVLNHEKNGDPQPWTEQIDEGRAVNLVMLRSAPKPPEPEQASCRAMIEEEARKNHWSEEDIRKNRADRAANVAFTVNNESGDSFDLFLVNAPWCWSAAEANVGQGQDSPTQLVKWRGRWDKWTVPTQPKTNVFRQFDFNDPPPSGWFLILHRYWDLNTNKYQLKFVAVQDLFKSTQPSLTIGKAESPIDYRYDWSF
ncbi:MAG: hypothetical protein ACLQIB_13170 [Isosphaeraceae bacterium]